MADGRGGYHPPAKPAAVSGPGKYSQRTDGQVLSAAPDQDYGDMKAQIAAQHAAPMAGQAPLPAPPSPGAPSAGSVAPSQGDFTRPTERPDEPITAGSPIGPGPGPSFAPMNPGQGTGQMTALLQRLSAQDTTGILGQLYLAAQARNA